MQSETILSRYTFLLHEAAILPTDSAWISYKKRKI